MTVPMLRSLSLQRFRSFPTAEIEFGNPAFLVGQNGAGKSNLVDVFAFLAETMTSPLSAVFERRGGFVAVCNRRYSRGRPSNLGVKVKLENLDDETSTATYAFELRALEKYDFRVVREQCIVNRCDGSRDWFDRNSKKNKKFNSSVESLNPVLEENALALPLVGGDTRFEAVVRFMSKMSTYRIDPVVLREMQDPDGGVRLRSDGGNVTSVIREIKRDSQTDWEKILDLMEGIVPKTVGVATKKHGNKLTLEFTQEWADSNQVRFEAYNMSDGTLRALGLLAAVFQRTRPSVLVIEEPEATIHPGALSAVLDLLRHAKRFMQVVVTTHSPDILNADWIEDRHLRIVNWEEGTTRVAPVSEATRTALGKHLMGAGELLRSNTLTAIPDCFINDPSKVPLFETVT